MWTSLEIVIWLDSLIKQIMYEVVTKHHLKSILV